MRLLLICLAAISAFACTSFHPVEINRVTERVSPGDTVRLQTLDGEQTLLALIVTQDGIRGRTDDGQLLTVSSDQIKWLEVERLNMRKTALVGILPAVLLMAVLCASEGCETWAVITATH